MSYEGYYKNNERNGEGISYNYENIKYLLQLAEANARTKFISNEAERKEVAALTRKRKGNPSAGGCDCIWLAVAGFDKSCCADKVPRRGAEWKAGRPGNPLLGREAVLQGPFQEWEI